jgi:hypothetical protein
MYIQQNFGLGLLIKPILRCLPKLDQFDFLAIVHECCGDCPIAFHGYKDAKWFYHLENHFYEANLPVDEDENKQPIYAWRNPDQTKPYFERVKKALCNTN